jgi:hypothetical protein
LLGEKHPAVFDIPGVEAWKEIWPTYWADARSIGAFNRPHELECTLRRLLKNGLTKGEIKEIFLSFILWSIGWDR